MDRFTAAYSDADATGSHQAAFNTDSTWRFSETKKSGLMGTGGIGITVGSSKSVHDLRDKGTTQSQSASTVGSRFTAAYSDADATGSHQAAFLSFRETPG